MTHKLDYRALSLVIPASASALGFFCFGVLAFSFTELSLLPPDFRTALVLVGAFALAFGAEVGTLASVVEIYRKGERLGRWDQLALVVSVAATFGAFLLSWAELLGAKATWGATERLYGPVALGLLAALDSYGGFMEFGLYLSRKDAEAAAQRARWRDEMVEVYKFEVFKAEQQALYKRRLAAIEHASMDDTQPIAVPAAALAAENAELSEQLPKQQSVTSPVAKLPDWRRIAAGLNGQRATLTAADVAALVKAQGLTLPSQRTLENWARQAREAQL